MRRLMLFVWQLPQNIVGLFVLLLFRNKREDGHWRFANVGGSISLGSFVVLGKYAGTKTLQHETGHQVQSRYLGPLYLLVIGIPSFVWASLRTLFPSLHKCSYYAFYTEKWADKLGGVKR